MVEYVFISNLLANAVLPIFLYPCFKHFRWSFVWKSVRPMFFYAIPLLIAGIAFSINEVLDRLFIKYHLPEGFYENLSSMEALGVYSACYKLSIIISLGVQAYRYAADPFFFSRYKEKKSPKIFALAMKYFIIICSLLFLIIALYLDIFSLFLRKEVYRQGIHIVPYLLMANIFLGIYFNLSIWYKIKNATFIGACLSIFGAMVTILGNYYLIPLLGYTGSALATLCCYFSMSMASYLLGQKYYPIPYHIKNAFFYMILSVILYFIGSHIIFEVFSLQFFYKFILIIFFIAIIFFKERKEIRTLINNI